MILAIDPGKDKCGLAVLTLEKKVIERQIVKRSEIITTTLAYLHKYQIITVVIGASSNGKKLAQEFADNKIKCILLDEKNSTLEARKLYWQENPPQGLWKFIPTSLRVPPVAVDDYAAVIIGERYLT
ncbi:resolvase [Candidatus Saganbacteria bacterium CG08_land_8_20_14_0_20_45_16]|uniref:Resolvase n=1 Tax=Candidatus Saganbacteria bacterium CG08_land_8_20_14_0_20_45_16 TaxID=2014293 RepID=A0A2H0XT06_UNCSA|nr:MAG: resolvase [Candidatus Saganbacteria bacterium CG08_land_8_20_14_0_20_45_16]